MNIIKRMLAAGTLCAALLLAAAPAALAMYDCTGTWDAEHMFSEIEIHVTQTGDRIEGVAYVYGIFGGVDTYHFQGRVFPDGRIEASHHSGHTFEGRMISENQGEGVLTTAVHKYHIHLEATRRAESQTGDEIAHP